MPKKYYEAYDDRYRQVHSQNIQWFSENPSPIVRETIETLSLSPQSKLLEIGWGEGRDAYPLLRAGYDLLATDVSPEAIAYCKNKFPDFADRFSVLDCVSGKFDQKFDFIYAVAVIHMLVVDEDRNAFYRFIRTHLNPHGTALICTMGDGVLESSTDPSIAFNMMDRTHEQTGKNVRIASTSCRRVSFDTFEKELLQNGFTVIQKSLTAVPPSFPQMMYAVVIEKA